MMKRMAEGFKRMAALMMCLFILLSQFAMPVTALAQDVMLLPTLHLHYAAGETVQTQPVMASLYGQQPVYWATLPAEAMQTIITLEIVPTGVEGESYNSVFGYELTPQDAFAVDGMTMATYIEVYAHDMLTGSYPLYLSSQPLPPVQFDPQPVQVNCFDQNGQLIGGYADVVGMEGREFYAPEMDGYRLTSAQSIFVSMDMNGQLSQSTVDFYYEKALEAAPVDVICYDQNGNIITSYQETIDPAGREVYAPELDGFDLTGAGSVFVSMDTNGQLNPGVVEFYYAAKHFDPVAVEVRLLDQDGNLLSSYQQDVGMEGFVFYAETLDGYTLTSAPEVSVTMDENGQLSQSAVEFWYAKNAPEPVSVEVRFLDQDGVLISSYTDTVTAEGRTFYAQEIDGYTLTSAPEVSVIMDENGQLSQSAVEFWYAKNAPEPVSVEVRFLDQDGALINSHTDTVTAEGRTFYAQEIEGYTLTSAPEVTVIMNGDGTLSQNVVEFYYSKNPEQPSEPVKATVTMLIVDSQNYSNVFFTETRDCAEGSHTFAPRADVLPENYRLDSEEAVTVNVYADGTADLYEVVFTASYHAPEQPSEPEQPAEPAYASITMQIVDSANWDNVFYTHTDWYAEGAHTFAPQTDVLPENYVLDRTDAVTVNVYADGTADLYEIMFTASYHAPEQPETPEEPEEPEEPEKPENPENSETDQPSGSLPEGVTLIENLDCQGETTKGKLRLRSTPTTDTSKNIVFENVAKGVLVQVTCSVQNAKGELWYGIVHNGQACYVRGDCLQLVSSEPLSFPVTFLYEDAAGNTLMDSYEESLAEGSYATALYAKAAPEGYELSGVSAENVVVDANGANPSTVIFTYTAVEKEPAAATFTFEYVCEGQHIIDPVSQTLSAGSYSVSDYVRQFEGYTFNGASQETLVVNEDGTSSALTVTFDYNRNPIFADVTIYHRLADGSDVPGLAAETRTLEKNTYDVKQFIQYAEGYSFVSASAETIVVDENGANPAQVTLTYQKDLIQAKVMIYAVDAENDAPLMDGFEVVLGEGPHAAAEVQPADPDGYTYSHASHEQIMITSGGADPASVTFYYDRIPTQAQVTFHFADGEGNPVAGLESYSVTLAEGAYDTAAYAFAAPSGYQYSGVSAAQIVVDRNGAAPAEVFFYYEKLPEAVSIPVIHQDGEGRQLLETTSLSFSAADFGKTINVLDVLNVEAPEGYVYAGISSETITIDQRGGVTPEAIQITYVVRPKATAEVTFFYLCDGKNIADPHTAELSEGTWETNEYAIVVDGYDLVNVDAQTVTIDENGSATPAEVNFIYEKRVTTANLTVHYRNSFGEELPGSPEIRPLEKGTHTITPNAAYVPEGYVLSANTQVFTVTVNNDLTLSAPSVSFNYYDKNLTGTVTVNYYDTQSGTTFATEEVKLAPGTHELQPNEALVKSKGNYQKGDFLTNSVVTVDEKGVATPTAIVFYYKPAEYTGYQGYLLVTQQTALRQSPGADGSVLMTLPVDTVLATTSQYQSGAIEWYGAQTATGQAGMGWVDGTHVRRISAEEAKIRIEEANQPEELEQNPGYYITIMNNVPLRQYKNTASQAKYLNVNTVVWVDGQEYDDSESYVWHAATYSDYSAKKKYPGFIRDGQLRKLTQEEVDEYLSANDPIKPEESTNPYDPNGPSSYGYVTKDSVNFRSEPGGTRIKLINKYGMALIVGTRQVNGVTWYNVNYSGQVGWIHGDYFHQMTLTEFTSFMGSQAYYQGITNNTPTSSGNAAPTAKPSTGSTGSATQGNVSSVEDWNVGVWQNTGVTNTTTYQPFNPYATPVATTSPKGKYTVDAEGVKFHQMASDQSSSVTLPKGAEITIAGTVNANGKTWYQVNYDGRNGYVEAAAVQEYLNTAPTPTPTSTFVIGTMIPITYEDESKETQTGSVPWGLLGGAIVLVGGAGGVYAYALNQNKRRKAAARAAASRRATTAGTMAAGAASPYARRAVAAAPGTQQRPAQPVPQQYERPVQQPVNAQQPSPYARPQQPSAAAQPARSAQMPVQPVQQVQPTQPASPAQPAPAAQQTTANPYARPAPAFYMLKEDVSGSMADMMKDTQKDAANPYARPITPADQHSASSGAQSAATGTQPQRRTRMQRYHDAGGDSQE